MTSGDRFERRDPRDRLSFVWATATGVFLALMACGLLAVLFWPGTSGQAAAPGPGRWPTMRPMTRTPTPPYPAAERIPTPRLGARATAAPPPEPAPSPAPAGPTFVPPDRFAAVSASLAEAIAGLNRAELRFVDDAAPLDPDASLASAPGVLDDDLAAVVARALDAGRLAESLAFTAASQDGASAAAALMAEQYNAVARLGYALAIEAQNAREGLASGKTTRASAAGKIAEYGARLWTPDADTSVKGNPFAARVKNAGAVAPVRFLSKGGLAALAEQGAAQMWLATSQDSVTVEVTLPEAAVADPDRQAAAEALRRLSGTAGAPPAPGAPLRVRLAKGVAVAGPEQAAAGVLPSFDRGMGSWLWGAQLNPAGGLVDDLYELGGPDKLTVVGQAKVEATGAAVKLTISGVRVGSVTKPTGGEGVYEATIYYDVSWQSQLKSSTVMLRCGDAPQYPISGNGSSSEHHNVTLGSLPAERSVGCRAMDGAATLGSAYASVVIGDPTDATATAQALHTQTAQTATSAAQTKEAQDKTATAKAGQTQTAAAQRTATAAAKATSTARALGTEVAATQTAEFVATVTEIARQTEEAGAAGTFTMNGSFNLNLGKFTDSCNVGPTDSAGSLSITVNLATGAASGTLSGGGGSNRAGLVCNGITFDVNCSASYSAALSGSVDKATGALSLSGTLIGDVACPFTNCQQGGQSMPCGAPGSSKFRDKATVSGTLDLAGHTAKGTITAPGGSGDWSAG